MKLVPWLTAEQALEYLGLPSIGAFYVWKHRDEVSPGGPRPFCYGRAASSWEGPVNSEPRVYPCLLRDDQAVPLYLLTRAVEGVIAPGRRVEVRLKDGWRRAMVVTPWPSSSLGSVVYLQLSGE